MWSKPCIAVALMAGLGAAVTAQVESVGVLLQKGIYQEETVGDLDAAMKIYHQIVADEKADRPHAAQAKYRLGMCHVKKGENEKAVETFEELIQEFPGQAKLVEQARGQLAAMGHAPESEEPAGVELQEVWSIPGLDDLSVLAISRDGRHCAFVDPETDDLAVRDLTTGEDQRLIEATAGRRIVRLAISPDNKLVAYAEYSGGEWCELRIVGVDGSKGRVLYANEEKSHVILRGWGPESQHLLATLHDIPRDRPRNSPTTVRIVVVSVSDGSLSVLKEFTTVNPTPRFSPDGRYVAYHGKTDEDSNHGTDIFLILLNGGEEVPLIEHPDRDLVLGWIPDSQNFLFLSDRGGGWHAWMIRVVDGRPQGVPRRITKGVVSTGWSASAGPVRTPTGGWAFYYVSVAEGAFVRFGQLERLTFYGLGELCMSKWAIHRG